MVTPRLGDVGFHPRVNYSRGRDGNLSVSPTVLRIRCRAVRNNVRRQTVTLAELESSSGMVARLGSFA